MPTIDPTADQLAALAALPDPPAPLVMLNLLRFRDEADYPDGLEAEPCSGRHAYRRYGAAAAGPLAEAGGRVLWMGAAELAVIAPEGEAWDEVLLVEYPGRDAFLGMIATPAYQAAVPHRRAALADSRLILTRPADR